MHVRVAGHTIYSAVREDPEEMLLRGQRQRDGADVLVRTHAAARVDRETLARYHRAQRLVKELPAASVCHALDLVETPERAALVYPAAGQELLVERARGTGMSAQELYPIAIALAQALDTIHGAGWMHGDVRPSSVMLDASSLRATFLDLQWSRPARAPDDTPVSDGMLPYLAPERTGRVGRTADHRADLYSLGATLFELLCGRPPFVAHDHLELIHGHIAGVPPSVREQRGDLPQVLAEIVGKLLAKAPEERYQSCRGLLSDLQRAHALFRSGDAAAVFELGRDDLHAQLQLPDKLYGREAERALLRECLDRASTGHAELFVVAGPPGVGKSALVADVEDAVFELGGFFIAGKFDQLLLNAPYSAIKRAFEGLLQHLLGDPEERIAYWRERLREAVGTQGRIMTDLMPSLERVIGIQPGVEVLGPVEAQQRFAMVFRRFVRVFAQPAHPLVLFLDDWQWVDAASAGLIQELLAAAESGALLLIIAYRDTELSAANRAHVAIERIKAASVPATLVTLPPLSPDQLQTFVREALGCTDEHAAELAAVVAARTGGNPFFVRSFLQALHETGKLSRDGAGWRCDLAALERDAGGEGVLELVVARLGRVPAETRELLELAACLGSESRTRDLATAAGLPAATVVAALAAAVDAALVTRGASSFRFVHDRVQEAAYTSIPRETRAGLHVSIGRRLLEEAERAGGSESLAQAIAQLNAGRAVLHDPAERLELARLNLRAGQAARQATAYASAAGHAAVGIELLTEDGWTATYALALDLHALRAESEYLSGQFAIAEELYEVALRHARDRLDRIRILAIKKDQYELQGRYLDAIAVLREGLALVGILLPDSDAELQQLLAAELAQIAPNLRGRPIEALIDEPEITDPELIATLQLLMGLWPSCYVAGQQRLLTVVSAKIANFCLVHGNCEVASAAYVNYSFVAGYVTGDYATAYEFGRLGIALSERYANRAIRSWCYFLFGCGTAVWRRPLADCTPYLERSFQLGVESGSLASACYACSYVVTDSFFQGRRLAEVEALYTHYAEFLKAHNPAIHMYLELGIRSMRRLVERDTFDEPAFLAAFQQSPFFMATYAFGQLAAAYHLDAPERAAACADAASDRVSDLLAGIFKVPEAAMYAALAWLAASELAPAGERARMRAAAANRLATLQQLAGECEESFAHKALIVEGELARIDGRLDEAAALLDRAADSAARAGFTQNAALACELAARVWHLRGFPRAARAYLQEAYETYRAWGATAKLHMLQARHPELLASPPHGGEPTAASAASAPLDLLSVAKASQAISHEIELDHLLARLMHVMIENAGARRGALIAFDGDQLRVLAVAEGPAVTVPSAARLEAADHVAESIVRYVMRTEEVVLLDDASRDERFGRDPQVRRRRCRSVVCLPLRLKDRVIGALYLENELSAAAFTPAREVILELLAGQAAISLDNARLYTDLKAAIRRLDEARMAAEAANQAKDQFLAMLGHELRNPLAPVLTACDLMAMQGHAHFARERAVIERQVKHMARLVDDLLDVSRIASGKIDLVKKPIDVVAVVNQAIEQVSPLVEQRGTPLDVRSPGAPVLVHGDPTRLAQVVSNVLTNAVKFSDPGGVISISVDVDVGAGGGDAAGQAVIRIADRGAGIAAEILPRIFDLFVQANQQRDRRMGGLGLGLSIARNLVELHGGTITARSDGPGRGSEFEIRLPCDAPAAAAHPPPLAGDAAGTARPRAAAPKRVLVIDDNVDAAQLLAETLGASGYEVMAAHDGPSALKVLESFRPDIAVLDLGLPLMDGFELARLMRSHPGLSSIKLIALTGYGQPEDRERSAAAGFAAHFVKPVDSATLRRTIQQLLGP